MDGGAIMEFALDAVPETIGNILKIQQWEKTEVAYFFLHQANEFMLILTQLKLLQSYAK